MSDKMTSKEALEELAKVYGYYFGDRYQLQEMKKVIEDEIRINEIIKNNLMVITTPVEPVMNDDGTLTFASKYIVKMMNEELNEAIKHELTKWIIKNINKEVVRRWLEND